MEKFKNVNVTGDYPKIARKSTGIFSLDLALSGRGELGIPIRSFTEIYGKPGSGKSTLAYYLMGALADPGDRVVIGDIEMLDREYLNYAFGSAGFEGEVNIISTTEKKKKEDIARTHEAILTETADKMEDENTPSVMFDSIGAVQPLAEKAGDFGEAFMGRRAKMVAQFCRRMISVLRDKKRPSTFFAINHVHSVMGGRGHSTPGGQMLEHASAQRLQLWPKETFVDSKTDDILGFLVQGKTVKHRYGAKGKLFQFYIVPGMGVHHGATAMFDCLEMGYAQTTGKIDMDDQKYDYRVEFLRYAATGKQLRFAPFVDKLNEVRKIIDKGGSVDIPEASNAEGEDQAPA